MDIYLLISTHIYLSIYIHTHIVCTHIHTLPDIDTQYKNTYKCRCTTPVLLDRRHTTGCAPPVQCFDPDAPLLLIFHHSLAIVSTIAFAPEFFCLYLHLHQNSFVCILLHFGLLLITATGVVLRWVLLNYDMYLILLSDIALLGTNLHHIAIFMV